MEFDEEKNSKNSNENNNINLTNKQPSSERSSNSFQEIYIENNNDYNLDSPNNQIFNLQTEEVIFSEQNFSLKKKDIFSFNKFFIRRIILSLFFLSTILYYTHIYEKNNYNNFINEDLKFSYDSCIFKNFNPEFYKKTWKFFNSHKNLKDFFLGFIFYYYDFIFFLTCYFWIVNLNSQNWRFFFSVISLCFIKLISSQIYLFKNSEDIIWKLPDLPFFLTITNKNDRENYFFPSSIALFLIIIKELKENKFKKLIILTYLFMIGNIIILVLLQIQNLFGIFISLVLGLYLNKISLNCSKIFDFFYDFNIERKTEYFRIKKLQEENIIELKIRDNIEKILSGQKKNNIKLDNI